MPSSFVSVGSRRHRSRESKTRRCSIEALENRLLLSAVSWVGPATGSWSNTSNWSTGVVPQAGDDVTLNKSGSVQITLSSSTQINSLTIAGDSLTISGGTLASGSVTNGGSITVDPLAQLTVSGAYTESAGASLTLPSGSLTSGVGTNLLSNSGFEAPSAGSSTTTDPNVWGNWGTSYISTQYAHTGTQSLDETGSNSGVNQSFSVTPGVSYTASVYAMTPSSAKLTGPEEGILNLLFYNASGTQVGSKGITVLTANSAAGGSISGSVGNQGWNFYSTTGVAPSGAVTATVALQVGPYSGISGTAGGYVYWDDAAFGSTAATSAVVSAASVSNAGSIGIGAADSLAIAGTFSQSSSGTLAFSLSGPAASGLFGSLTAGGSATLGGTLNATVTGNYSPALSDGFTLLNYASVGGAFSTTQLPSGSSYSFQTAINPTYLGISALPTSITTAVNINSSSGNDSPDLAGVNIAWWDNLLTTGQTQSMVEAAGLNIFRFPGGSSSDDFHFNVAANYGDSSAITIPQFAEFVDSVGGQGIVTTDYGSGSPQEAEAELAYLVGSPGDTTVIGNGIEWNDSTGAWQSVNWQTVGYWASLRSASPLAKDDGLNFLRIGQALPFTGINDWEIGNEEYGSWEIDHHGTAFNGASTGAQHDPATYAQFAAAFASFVSADKMLPKISVGIDSGDPTGATDNNWTKNVLADGFADGFIPGFISDHSYMYGPGSESDPVLLNDTVSDPASIDDWSTRAADYRNMLVATLGSANAATVALMATEFNSNYGTPGKQMTSLVNGLFVADSIGNLLEGGYSAGLYWDLRNGWGTDGNNSPTLYGWREGGDEGLLGTQGANDPPITGPYIPYPSYFGEQIASKLVQPGGEIVSASSSYSELAVYTVLEANGHLDLLVINKNPDAAITDQFSLGAFTPTGQAQFWQYGEAQDDAQSQSTTGAASLANFNTSLNFSGSNFSYQFPAYSMTVIDLTPMLSVATAAAASPGTIVGSFSSNLSALGSENGSGNGLTYSWSATGPAPVMYTGATNGTNAAKNITANFSQTGIYNFLVTITDTGGQIVTSPVQVTVLPAFAAQNNSTGTITMNSIDPITLAGSGGNVTVTEAGYQYSFSGVSTVNISTTTSPSVLDFTGQVSSPLSFAGGSGTTVNVTGGSMTIAAGTTTLSALNVSTGAGAVMAPAIGTRSQLVVGSLSIAGGATLDLSDNQLFIDYGSGIDPIASISAWITSGFNEGTWNGASGIVSSIAALNSASYGLGYADSADPGNPAGLSSGQIEVMYTLLGDANLDGKVNGTDFAILSSNFNQAVSSWDEGDFNYDGKANGTDFALLSSNFNQGVVLPAVSTTSLSNATFQPATVQLTKKALATSHAAKTDLRRKI